MSWKYTNLVDYQNAMVSVFSDSTQSISTTDPTTNLRTPKDPGLAAEYSAFNSYSMTAGMPMQTQGDCQAVFNSFLQNVKPPGSNFWDGTYAIGGQQVPKLIVFCAGGALLLLLLAKN